MTADIPGVLGVVRNAIYGVGYIIWQVGVSSGVRNPNMRRLLSRWLSLYTVMYKQPYMMQGLMTQQATPDTEPSIRVIRLRNAGML